MRMGAKLDDSVNLHSYIPGDLSDPSRETGCPPYSIIEILGALAQPSGCIQVSRMLENAPHLLRQRSSLGYPTGAGAE